jgi:hypothetical protein
LVIRCWLYVVGDWLSNKQQITNNHSKQQRCVVVDEGRFTVAGGSAKCLEVAAGSWGEIWEVKEGVTGSNVSPEVAQTGDEFFSVGYG